MSDAKAEHWERLVVVYSGLEADTLRATLEERGIPVLVRGPSLGIFGGAYQGSVMGGVEVLVPASALDEARTLLPEE
jgi:hypothetical protein